MRTIAIAVLLLATVTYAKGETIVLKHAKYKCGDVVCKGAIADSPEWDRNTKRPGILIVHQWMGVTKHEQDVAMSLAELGYVVMVADIYGKDVRPQNAAEAGQEAAKYRGPNTPLFRKRLGAALEVLKSHKLVDPKKIAAIGYCFGGTGVLELARSGADISGVVSFHGGLGTNDPTDAKKIKCKVLVCHGADDPFVPEKEVLAFKKEMRDAKVDWQMNSYGGAVHAFTQPSAKMKGKAEYNAKAAKRSWKAMRAFFDEIFSGE